VERKALQADSGLFVPGEGPGHWPGAACNSLSVRASSESLSSSAMVVWPCSSTSTPLRVSSLHHAGDDLVQHRLQRLVGRRGCFEENRRAIGAAPVYAVQHQAVKANVEVGR